MGKIVRTRLIAILLIIVFIGGIVGYRVHKRNTLILNYIHEHKEAIYNLADRNSTHINFMNIIEEKNKSVIDSELSVMYHEVYDNLQLDIVYNKDGVDNTTLALKDYATIAETTLNNISYYEFDFRPLYIKEFNKNGQKKPELNFNTTIDTERIFNDIIGNIHEKIDIKMLGAKGKLSNGIMTITDNGKTGLEFNEEEVKESLNQLQQFKYTEFNGNYTLSISINPKEIEIYPKADDLLTINYKLSSFSTGYSSSGGSRKTNIAVAAKNLNGKILLPGESISVDKSIKSRNAANGYAKAGSYLNGKTVQTYGGGICQVSTTLYGAILRAGIIPSTRFAHSMSVGYVPLGLDAAISEGYKDLVFSNPYEHPIYIEATANGSTLTFSIWGDKNMLNGYTYQPKSSSSNGGLKANSWLEKLKDGQVVEKINLFKSSYRPHN